VSDGRLRALFVANLPDAHWQPIETWSTGQGVPDSEYCFPGGASGWIENKRTEHWAVKFETFQPAWIERRVRTGGRVTIAVRRVAVGGPRTAPADELWLVAGRDVFRLRDGGLRAPGLVPLGRFQGGPARWDWAIVRRLLTA
jgi:hypothetical protein